MSLNADNVIDVTEESFEKEVVARSKERPVVVDFWAAWCGPCRMLGPLLERLATEPDSNFILAKVDVDANPGLAMQYQVQGIPAVKGFRDGKVVAAFVGAQPEPQVRAFLRRLAPSDIDLHLSAAAALQAEKKWPEAEGAYRLVLERNPREHAALFGLAQVLLLQGNGCAARDLLAEISEARFISEAERLRPLADFLCETAESNHGNSRPDYAPLEAQYRHAARLMQLGNYPAALDGLIDILRQDKQFRQGEAKAVVLAVFALLGDESELTRRYRSELAMVLF